MDSRRCNCSCCVFVDVCVCVCACVYVWQVSRHKGFIRIAIKTGATLLPIFCFGDTKLMDNVNMKPLQRKSKNIIGFPFPFVPYGE